MGNQNLKNEIFNVLELYLQTLKESGEDIPDWVSSVRFCYDENLDNAAAYVDADDNSIVFGPYATPHAIFHELEHIRSRHKKRCIGLDEEFNQVEYYNVGFSNSGFNGVFLEEGFNELAARKLSIRACKNDSEKLTQLYKEFRENKYYNFEMYICFSICSLLNIKVSNIYKMKFSGDSSSQEFLDKKFEEISNNPNAWKDLQAKLDLYEYAKKSLKGDDFATSYKKLQLFGYAEQAYDILFKALENHAISSNECIKRLRQFDYYLKKSQNFINFKVQDDFATAKQESIKRNKRVITRNHILTYVGKNRKKITSDNGFVWSGDLIDYIPAKKPSLPWFILSLYEKNSNLEKSISSMEPLIEESALGL